MKITIDGGQPITWSAFVQANSDGFEPEELATIKAVLLAKGRYEGGGGAAAPYVLLVVDPEVTEVSAGPDSGRHPVRRETHAK